MDIQQLIQEAVYQGIHNAEGNIFNRIRHLIRTRLLGDPDDESNDPQVITMSLLAIDTIDKIEARCKELEDQYK